MWSGGKAGNCATHKPNASGCSKIQHPAYLDGCLLVQQLFRAGSRQPSGVVVQVNRVLLGSDVWHARSKVLYGRSSKHQVRAL